MCVLGPLAEDALMAMVVVGGGMGLSPRGAGWPTCLVGEEGRPEHLSLRVGGIARAPSPHFLKVQKRGSRRCVPAATIAERGLLVPVEELWNLSSWLPGYKIICPEFPRRGLAGEPQAGESGESGCCWECSEYIRSYLIPIYVTSDSPTAQLPS